MRWRDAEGGAPSTPSAAASLREGVASYRERARTRETEREDRKRRERERERGRALPGTLEVNVLRMVGRCLVCSRLISTWVSSLEPPPSTPSTVLHLHTHSHTPSTRTDRAALPPSVFNATDIKRLVCSCTAQSSCPFHMSHLLASSPPFADPTRSRTLRRSVSSILPLTRPTFHARLARSLVQPVNNRAPLL